MKTESFDLGPFTPISGFIVAFSLHANTSRCSSSSTFFLSLVFSQEMLELRVEWKTTVGGEFLGFKKPFYSLPRPGNFIWKGLRKPFFIIPHIAKLRFTCDF